MSKKINHINEDKLDNRVKNLEYITHKENCNYGTRNSRMATSKPLIQCDLHGNEIRRFNSASGVQRVVDYRQTCKTNAF